MRNSKGFSIVEGVIAAGVVAVSILAIGTMVAKHASISKRTETKQELPGVGTDVLNRARSVLLAVKGPVINNQGLCALLSPEEVKPGVVPINIDLTKVIAAPSVWQQTFAPEWTVLGFEDNRSRIKFTLAPAVGVNSITESKGIRPGSLSVKVSVYPRKMDPTGTSDKVFSDISTSDSSIDAKRVVFFMESEANFEELGEGGQIHKREAKAKEMVSVIDIGGCQTLGLNNILLNLSPAGTGSGDPVGITIYNDTQYASKGQDAFKFTFAQTEVTQGRYLKGRLSADREKNAVSACTETVYRCPKRNEPRHYRPFINVTTGINYYPLNKYTSRKISPVRVIPKLEMLNSAGADEITLRNLPVSYATRPNETYKLHTDGLYYIVTEAGIQTNRPFSIGENQSRIVATISDAEPLCQSTCGGERPKSLKPMLDLTTPDLLITENNNSKWVTESSTAGALSCTMCFVKGCSRMGLETFGPLEETPPEPLDAHIPECSIEDKAAVNQFLPIKSDEIAANDDGKCISAKIQRGKLVYTSRNCADSLPVACFAFGEYRFARVLGSTAPTTMPFANAHAACRNMGREEHPVNVLRQGFAQQGASTAQMGNIPESGGVYKFLNLAKTGSFVAPQAVADQSFAVSTLEKSRGGHSVSDFWVALRTLNGHIVAEIPYASTTNQPDERHMIYYDAAGRITHTQVDMDLSSLVNPGSGADRAHIILNHVKFRGVVSAAQTQSRALSFLCMREDKSFFVSEASHSSFNRGGSVCQSQNGLFVAPTSSLGWIDAMIKVEKHLSYAPFSNSSDPRRVWVALEGDGAIPRPALFGELESLGKNQGSPEHSSKYVDENGAFIKAEGNETKKKIEWYPIPSSESGGTRLRDIPEDERPASLDSDPTPTAVPAPPPQKYKSRYIQVPNPNFSTKIACYSRTQNNIQLYNSEWCPNRQIRIMTHDLKKPIFSTVWVLSKKNFNLRNNEFIRVKD